MESVTALVEALSGFAWPLLSAVLLWKMLPVIEQVARSRAFQIKFGDMSVSVQEASDQLRAQVEDLQEKVAQLRKATTEVPMEALESMPTDATESVSRRVLWVDDKPSNNAFEVARLKDAGIDVAQVTSTTEAMGFLASSKRPVSLVISDMGRRENGRYRAKAGIELLEEMRTVQQVQPFLVYTSARYIERDRQLVAGAGGQGATASPVELFEMLEKHIGAVA